MEKPLTIQEAYKDLLDQDLIEPIRMLLDRGVYKFNPAGKLEADLRVKPETPWVHIRQDPLKNCGLWHQIWFNYYNIVPSYCQNCWKVVARPTTLTEMFVLYEIMRGLDLPSKLGIERRYSVPALYGAYFYNNSPEEGQRCFEDIQRICHDRIGPHVKVILKRGCTEFEHKFGDSSKWEVTENQKQLERRLEDLFAEQPKIHDQGPELIRHIMANWVRFAYAQGDPTASEFSSKPIYPPYVTYHKGPESVECGRDYADIQKPDEAA